MSRLVHASPLLAGLLLLVASCGDDAAGGPSDAAPPDGAPADAGDAGAEPDGSDAAPPDDGPIHMVLAASGDAGFFERPFPLETRRRPDGHPSLAGFPNPRRVGVLREVVALAEEETTGFSPAAAIWMRFTGPLDATRLPDPAASRADASPVVLVNVDPASPDRGARTPVIVAMTTERDSFRPANLLQVRPLSGFNLAERTLHAVVVRRSIGTGDTSRPLEVDPALAELLAGREPDVEDGAALAAAFAPLVSWLADAGIAADEVVGATVFRTGDVTSRLYRTVELVRDDPAPEPIDGPERTVLMDEYCGYEGVWAPALYQDGESPFLSEGGRMHFDADGRPVEQARDEAPFAVSVPRGAMPAAGFPLLFYVNGTGGLARQVLDRGVQPSPGALAPEGTGPAQVVARHGWGASGHAALVAPERTPADSADGFAMYNFFNPVAMRDNFFQAVIEYVRFRRLVLGLRLDPASCPGVDASASPDGLVRFDPERMAIMGQSLGSYLSEMLAATDPGFDGVILTGAGGSWAEFALGPSDPIALTRTIEISLALSPGEHLDRFHPAVAAFELAVAEADNTEYADDILLHPREGHATLPMLIVNGHEDRSITFGLQQALAGAVAVDLVGADVGPVEEQVLPRVLLAGRSMLEAPAARNVETRDGPRTGAMVRYLPDFPDFGHYVAFQLPEPRRQYECFLQTLYDEAGPVIVPGDAPPTAPCAP